ncbi:uncharacterized protein EV420DRAFT_1695189 [Desarmillaria tabescens]|uniref:Uncharacterized protein n=1 Tax=Armillaria tabescens TaxID=1929756 RepID=A0AA39MFX7_ARMTA|nr:uncharacterized protein EV420DRAFT_1695189 [Desarmillaria tabescens]KAK0432827.1 hypothetical protein EV420DRAFT_1695189 [Desarmillaria tabescens]
MGADPEAPGPTETITVHPGGALNARFFIPGLEHHSPAPASQPPTSHGTPPTPPPPVTSVPQQSARRCRRQPDPDDDNPFTSTPECSSRHAQPLRNVQFSGGETFNIEDLSEPSTPATPMPVLWPCTEEVNVIQPLNNVYKQLVAPPSYEAPGTLADKAEGPVAAYRESKGQDPKQNSSLPSGFDEVPGFSLEAFIDALVAFIVSNDQSFNVVESLELRWIFLMLREELTDDDIPRRTQIWKRVMEIWEDHLKQLSKEMQVCTILKVLEAS